MFKVHEKHRVITGPLKTTEGNGNNGIFDIPIKKDRFHFLKDNVIGYLRCIVSDINGWERVSFFRTDKRGNHVDHFPSQEDIWAVRTHFWSENDVVVQMFFREEAQDPKAPRFIHLWKKIGSQYEIPIKP